MSARSDLEATITELKADGWGCEVSDTMEKLLLELADKIDAQAAPVAPPTTPGA